MSATTRPIHAGDVYARLDGKLSQRLIYVWSGGGSVITLRYDYIPSNKRRGVVSVTFTVTMAKLRSDWRLVSENDSGKVVHL